MTPEQIIRKIVSKCVPSDPPSDDLASPVIGQCMTWTKGRGSHGYGTVYVGGKMTTAHRAIMVAMGFDASGMHVDHLCRNVLCCNPSHLDVVTPMENARRGARQRHIVNERCADCGSTVGKIVRVKGGHGWQCRPCALVRERRYRANRPDHVEARIAAHREATRDDRNEARRATRAALRAMGFSSRGTPLKSRGGR